METIIAAGIGGVVSLIVCVITNVEQSSKTRALLEYKLEELTALQEEKIKVANHRIDDLEKEEK